MFLVRKGYSLYQRAHIAASLLPDLSGRTYNRRIEPERSGGDGEVTSTNARSLTDAAVPFTARGEFV
ncbi:MAG: hypothetical protein P8Y44_07225 [Acidobacteriota bacterium]